MPAGALLFPAQQPTLFSSVKTGEISKNFHAKFSQYYCFLKANCYKKSTHENQKPHTIWCYLFSIHKKNSYFLCIDFTPTLISTSLTSTFFSISFFCRDFFGLVLIFASISKSRKVYLVALNFN